MKKIRLNEDDLTRIIERVIKEQEEFDLDIEGQEGGIEDLGDTGEGLEITLDQIAMLLKDGECECGGQKLVLNLSGGGEEEEVDDEIDYDEQLAESKRKVKTLRRK